MAVEKKAKKSKSSEDGSKVKGSVLEIASKAIEKDHGVSLKWLNDVPEEEDIISSGSISLDFALAGGYRRGRAVEVYGAPGCGKSTAAFMAAAAATQAGHQALLIDVERSLKPTLAKNYGIIPERLAVVNNLACGEDYLAVTEKYIKTKEFAVCIIDSVDALISKVDLESEMSDQSMGQHARLMSRCMRRFVSIIGESNTLLLLINQMREKMAKGGYGGGGKVTPGGNAIPFYASQRVSCWGGASKSSRLIDPETNEVSGHTMSFEIVKNKLGPPFRTGEVDLYYGVGYDAVGEVIRLATDLGIIALSGAWFVYDDRIKAQGKAKMRLELQNKPDVFNEIYFKVCDTLGLDYTKNNDIKQSCESS